MYMHLSILTSYLLSSPRTLIDIVCQYTRAPEKLFISPIDETSKTSIGKINYTAYIVKAFRLGMLRTIFSCTPNLDANPSLSNQAGSSTLQEL
jgi:hypothetical protein